MMPQHIDHWLGAYLDGELGGSRRKVVEAHLEECPACRAQLEELSKLSTLLKAVPARQLEMDPRFYAAQIEQRLPREAAQPGWQKAFQFCWKAAPVLFVALWAFVQAMLIVSAAVPSSWVPIWLNESLSNLGSLYSPLPWAVSLLRLVFSDLALPDFLHLPVLIPEIPSFVQGFLERGAISFVGSALTALMLASWVVGGWAYRRYLHNQLTASMELVK